MGSTAGLHRSEGGASSLNRRIDYFTIVRFRRRTYILTHWSEAVKNMVFMPNHECCVRRGDLNLAPFGPVSRLQRGASQLRPTPVLARTTWPSIVVLMDLQSTGLTEDPPPHGRWRGPSRDF